MDAIADRNSQYAGVADLMRWEILLNEGGFALDADSVCVRRLPDWLFDCDLFAVWENEYVEPGLVANGYVGARPGHEVISALVDRFVKARDLTRRFVWYKMKYKGLTAWKTTGPVPFTEELRKVSTKTATILPSHFFLPRHHSGLTYNGTGPVFSCELFAGSSSGRYSEMSQGGADGLVEEVNRQLGRDLF
jgi:mannosyltransferase OCH1-like enzyme